MNASDITTRTGWVLAVFLAAAGGTALPGCANFDAYRKCGYHGCPGDAQISARVRALIAQYPALEPPNQVYVQTSDAVVFLTGQVATETQRTLATDVARSAEGVHRVVNNISLSYSGR